MIPGVSSRHLAYPASGFKPEPLATNGKGSVRVRACGGRSSGNFQLANQIVAQPVRQNASSPLPQLPPLPAGHPGGGSQPGALALLSHLVISSQQLKSALRSTQLRPRCMRWCPCRRPACSRWRSILPWPCLTRRCRYRLAPSSAHPCKVCLACLLQQFTSLHRSRLAT
jgi:hypothetical protein